MQEIHWLRPHEITLRPQFMDREGMNAGDIMQGQLGDSWLLSAVSGIAATRASALMGHLDPANLKLLETEQLASEQLKQALKSGVYPGVFHYYARRGIYVFRFMKDNKWRYVTIDDKIPCGKDKKPLFAKSNTLKEFWISLFEKAYAKLHGNYYNINCGFAGEAIRDLSGYIPDKIDLQKLCDKSASKINTFWDKLVKTSQTAMLCCSVQDSGKGDSKILKHNGVPSGLVVGHVYAILDVFSLKKPDGKGKSRLLRIRNPWGNTEWLGKWSDNSDELEKKKAEIDAHYKGIFKETYAKKFSIKVLSLERWNDKCDEDGTFLMCYKDWREVFTHAYISENLFNKNEYQAIQFDHSWTVENSGGTPIKMNPTECLSWARNPHAKLTVKGKGVELFVCVSQEDPRIKEIPYAFDGVLHPICFVVQKCEEGSKTVTK